jgi:hypothetical protein
VKRQGKDKLQSGPCTRTNVPDRSQAGKAGNGVQQDVAQNRAVSTIVDNNVDQSFSILVCLKEAQAAQVVPQSTACAPKHSMPPPSWAPQACLPPLKGGLRMSATISFVAVQSAEGQLNRG